MNLFTLSRAYIFHRPLSTLLNILLLSSGVATIAVLILFGHQLEDTMTKNGAGIDVVVGAKGSPIQLILSTVYQADVPTGNVSKKELDQLLTQPAVKTSIPLALGDSYHGFRIVGTSPDYIKHYGAQIREGRVWNSTLEVVLGADAAATTKFGLGARFAGSHGLVEGGEVHENSIYNVVGILQKTGTVLDRLILTPVESVWRVHEHEEPDSPEEIEEAKKASEGDHGITAALIEYSSPIAAATFPRFVNTMTSMQAASPAAETARLLKLVGVGLTTLRIFGLLLIVCAAFSVFVALYNALLERKPDLAIMRTLGASKFQLFVQVILEGVSVAVVAGLVGIGLAHIGLEVIARCFLVGEEFQPTGMQILTDELLVFAASAAVGLIAAIIPAIQAYRTDIALVLARR